MKVWVDVDNPPQARYLIPLARAAGELGCQVVVTARDYGTTFQILEDEQVPFLPVGSSFGKSKVRKVAGILGRSRELVSRLRSDGRPDLLLTASRSAALAAARLRIPGFVVIDYEFVDLRIYRFARSYILHAGAIPTRAFEARGIPASRLIALRGLKEELTFDGVDLDAVPAYPFEPPGVIRVLVRPAAEESHYYRSASRELTLALLGRLADTPDVQVVYSPRYESQVRDLTDLGPWRRPPIVLDRALSFVSLLKGVDAVVSAGGTMLREAAYLGVPAYSLFGGTLGAVDLYLESIGRLTLFRSQADFDRLSLVSRPPLSPILHEGHAARDAVLLALDRAGAPIRLKDPRLSSTPSG